MRHEFTKATKKAALARAMGRCEASGARYGLEPGQRCNADLSVTGVEHDHYPLGAHAEGSNTLENDVVCCPRCNQYAANHFDKAVEAKIKRIRRANGPIELRRQPKRKLQGRRFGKQSRPIESRPFQQKRTT